MTPSTPAGFRSLTARLIAWILLSCGAIFLVTLRLVSAESRRTARQVALGQAEAEARQVIARIEAGLLRVEDATRLLAAAVETQGPSEPELEALLRRFVAGGDGIFGAAAAFEPGAFRPGVERFAPYVCRSAPDADALVRRDLAAPGYRYFEKDWYTQAIGSGRARWSEPYLDEGGGGVRMVTFSVPVLRPAGKGLSPRGVVTADLTLQWLNAAAQGVAEGAAPDSRGSLQGAVAIVSRDGVVLAARKLELGKRLVDQLDAATREPMQRALDGTASDDALHSRSFEARGEERVAAWVRHRRTGWLIAVLYPAAQVFASADRLALLEAELAAGGLALLAVVVVLLSRRLAQPITALAASAGRLATGELDAELPPVRTRDEIGRLTRAFHEMRDSLKAYIRDLADTTRKKERLESELRAARRIQMAMLPKGTAGGGAEGFELAATLEPARDVGGDLYDYFVQGSSVFFLVGDVSGKGVPAALFMARAKMLFETVAARETDPGVILRQLNRGLSAENEAGMFVTVVCGSLDARTGDLVFACGGHEPPVHVEPAGAAPLEAAGGPLIGLLDDAEFPVNALRLAPGESVVMFTDGVSEAENAAHDMFGVERLAATLRSMPADGAPAVSAAVLAAVRAFAGEAPQSDDITILTLRYLSRPRG